jgi:hypothetical protein
MRPVQEDLRRNAMRLRSSVRVEILVLRTLGFPLAVSVLARSGVAQEVLWQRFGENIQDRFGSSVRFGGDADADGRPDLVVGAPGVDCNGTNLGQALVLRGMDGAEIQGACGLSGAGFANSVAGNVDVDGDGIDDFLVGAYSDDRSTPGGGAFAIYSADLAPHLPALDTRGYAEEKKI